MSKPTYFEGIPTAEEDDVEIRVRQKIQWADKKSIRITIGRQTEFIPRSVISGKSDYQRGDWCETLEIPVWLAIKKCLY